MRAHYLLRFDDVCPFMNWDAWEKIEDLLRRHQVRPIVAVVPDNVDPDLVAGDPNPIFWQRVREWRDLGWTIGMHGYQHKYVTGEAGILGLNEYSEFAGLGYEEQLFKLRSSMDIFRVEGINPDVWVAPAHSFDGNTLMALHEIGINAISDGYSLRPYTDEAGRFWVPQQLWGFRPLPLGVWTVCCHLNGWNESVIERFGINLQRYSDRIVSFEWAKSNYSQRGVGLLDMSFERLYRWWLAKRRNRWRNARIAS